MGSKPQAFVDRGFVFVSINYRLWPSDTIQQIAQDVRKSGNQKLAERDQERFGDVGRQKEMSSITYIARGKHIPPFLILYVADHPDTGGQSRRLFQALREAGVPARIHAAEGKDHTTINNDLGKPGDMPSQALYEFLNENSKVKKERREP